jgi:hypothetical protein
LGWRDSVGMEPSIDSLGRLTNSTLKRTSSYPRPLFHNDAFALLVFLRLD